MVDAADIERSYVGVSGFGFSQEAIDAKLRHAPQWVLDNVRAARAAAASNGDIASKAPSTPPVAVATSQRWAGWVAGIACCGVSNPAPLLKRDERRPEQFTDECLRKLFRQGNAGSTATELRWGHEGPVLATSENRDVLFTIEPHYFGLEFSARLADTAQNRRILAEIGDELVGVSLGFQFKDGYLADRDGQTVRVVTDANLHHVALIGRREGNACYPAAWAAAASGHRAYCPTRLSKAARLKAWPVIKQQAGCRS
jgi:hypothetical protein